MNFRDLQNWNDAIKGVGDAILQRKMAEWQQAETQRRQDLADRMADISQQNADTNEAYRRDSVAQRDNAAKATAQLRAEEAQQRIEDANQRIKAGDDRLKQQTADNFVTSVNRIQAGVKDGSITPDQARERLAQFYTLTDGFDDVQDAFAMNPGEWGAVIDAANGKNPFQKPVQGSGVPNAAQTPAGSNVPVVPGVAPASMRRRTPQGSADDGVTTTVTEPLGFKFKNSKGEEVEATATHNFPNSTAFNQWKAGRMKQQTGNPDAGDFDSSGVSIESPPLPGQPAGASPPPSNPLTQPPATNAPVPPTAALQAPDAAAAGPTLQLPDPNSSLSPPASSPVPSGKPSVLNAQPSIQNQADFANAMAQARAAISAGKDPELIKARLRKMGISFPGDE